MQHWRVQPQLTPSLVECGIGGCNLVCVEGIGQREGSQEGNRDKHPGSGFRKLCTEASPPSICRADATRSFFHSRLFPVCALHQSSNPAIDFLGSKTAWTWRLVLGVCILSRRRFTGHDLCFLFNICPPRQGHAADPSPAQVGDAVRHGFLTWPPQRVRTQGHLLCFNGFARSARVGVGCRG